MIAGIDFDTRAVHVVLLDDTPPLEARYFRFDLCAVGDAFDRTRNVRDAMPARTAVFWDRVTAIGLEEPRGPGNGALMRVQGAVLACLPAAVLVVPLIPSAWRTAVGLKGNATKAEVVTWSIFTANAPRGWLEQDPHDAHAIAHATRSLIRTREAA